MESIDLAYEGVELRSVVNKAMNFVSIETQRICWVSEVPLVAY